MREKFRRFKDLVMRLYSGVAALALLVLVFSAFAQVVGRYLLNASPSWSEELARYAFIWCSAWGAAVALDCGGHAVITVLSDHLKPKSRNALHFVMTLIVLVISAVLCVQGLVLAAATVKMTSPAMKIPMVYINISITFCSIGLMISSLTTLLELTYQKKNAEEKGAINL